MIVEDGPNKTKSSVKTVVKTAGKLKRKNEVDESLEEVVEDISKYRILGATVWLGMLVLIVPYWYSNPVNFVPNDSLVETTQAEPFVEATHAYILPIIPKPDKPEQSDITPLDDSTRSNASNLSSSKVSTEISTKADSDSSSEAAKKTNKQSSERRFQKSAEKAETLSIRQKTADQWIVRLITYKHKEDAELQLDTIRYKYPAWIKQYPKSKLYSLRVGPYDDLKAAMADEKELKQLLKVKTELVKIPPSMQKK